MKMALSRLSPGARRRFLSATGSPRCKLYCFAESRNDSGGSRENPPRNPEPLEVGLASAFTLESVAAICPPSAESNTTTMPSVFCPDPGRPFRKTDFAKASFSWREVAAAGFAGSTHSICTGFPFSAGQFPLKDRVSSLATLKIAPPPVEFSAALPPGACANPDGISSCARRIQPRDIPDICTCTQVFSTAKIGNSSWASAIINTAEFSAGFAKIGVLDFFTATKSLGCDCPPSISSRLLMSVVSSCDFFSSAARISLMESRFVPAGRENAGKIGPCAAETIGEAALRLLAIPGAGATGCAERRNSTGAGDRGASAGAGAEPGARLSAILSRVSVSRRPFEIRTRYPERAATGSLYQAVILALARIMLPPPEAAE